MNKRLKKLITATLVTAMCITAVGCSSKSNTASNSASSNSEAVAGYPVEVTTYNYAGDEVKTTYDKAPEKVLAVYQGSIETMLELGLEDRLVAAAGLDNELDEKYKKAFEKVEYLTEFTPSKETVTALNPYEPKTAPEAAPPKIPPPKRPPDCKIAISLWSIGVFHIVYISMPAENRIIPRPPCFIIFPATVTFGLVFDGFDFLSTNPFNFLWFKINSVIALPKIVCFFLNSSLMESRTLLASSLEKPLNSNFCTILS